MQRRAMALATLLVSLCTGGSGNPNLKYFSVWDAEAGCPGPVSPRPHWGGYYHYPNIGVACPGGCTIKVLSDASVPDCEAACNATSHCAAVEVDHAPSTNCTLLSRGGPGVGDGSRDTYVRDVPAATQQQLPGSVATTRQPPPPANLTCELAQHQWINFLFTSADPVVIKRYHAAGQGPALLHVGDTFFCGNRLCADYQAKWAALRDSVVRPVIELPPQLATGNLLENTAGVLHQCSLGAAASLCYVYSC